MKKGFLLITMLAVLALTACTSPGGVASSSHYIGNNAIENKGPVEGTDSSTTILFFPIGDRDFDTAIQNAVQPVGGDALVNMRWYNQDLNFIVFQKHILIVTGEAVQFKEKPAK